MHLNIMKNLSFLGDWKSNKTVYESLEKKTIFDGGSAGKKVNV